MRGIVALLMFILLASSVSAVVINHWGIYDDKPYYEYVDNVVYLDVSDAKDNIKVVFTIPELGVRSVKGPYDAGIHDADIYSTLLLPYDADYGEYVIRMTITDSEGNKRIKHRFIEIQ